MINSLNHKQRISLAICCFALFLTGAIPPWEYVIPAVEFGYDSRVLDESQRATTSAGSGVYTISAKYNFILNRPTASSDTSVGIRIDLRRLFVEWVGIGSLAMAFLLLFSIKQSQKE